MFYVKKHMPETKLQQSFNKVRKLHLIWTQMYPLIIFF
jgi:hypothetical protein